MAANSSSVLQPLFAMMCGWAMAIPRARIVAASCTGQRSSGSTPSPMVYESPRARNFTGPLGIDASGSARRRSGYGGVASAIGLRVTLEERIDGTEDFAPRAGFGPQGHAG